MPGDPVPMPHWIVHTIIVISIAMRGEQDQHIGENYITQVSCRQDDQL